MYYFIINPHAKSNLGIHIWKKIKLILDEKDIMYRELITRYAGHATEIACSITKSPTAHRTIIVMGGDGTLNEVLNGLNHIDNITLGYIPIGSSNDFARGMRIEKAPEELLKDIISGNYIKKLDFGEVICGSHMKRYLVSSGIGFDAAVCYTANSSSIKKELNAIKLGKLSYTAIALNELRKQPTVTATLTLDSGESIHMENMFLAATHNLPYEGGGFMFCPEANPQDGYLDICVANDISKLNILSILPTAYSGKHIHKHGISIYRCKTLLIHTEFPLHIHTDGESVEYYNSEGRTISTHTDAHFRISEHKLNFIHNLDK